MTSKLNTALRLTIGIVGCVAALQSVYAQGYPNRPLRFIVGFPPGGGNDVVARVVAPHLSEALGQQVIIENRPGATGTVAASMVAKSPPDGYTLLVGAVSTNAIAGSLYPNLPYDPERDLSPVTLLASIPQLIAVHPALEVKTVRELIDFARANPGKLRFPSAGNGSTPHITGEIFKSVTGTDLQHVPYKGAGQALPDLLAGRVQVSFDTTGTIISYVTAGKLRALAIAAPKRFALIPDVPTAAEAGLHDFEISTWIGLFSAGGTPAAIVDLLHARIAAVLRKPEVRNLLVNNIGSDDSVTGSPAEFAALLKRDIARYAKVIKAAGIRAD
jgi:tripartite-type tricarboxylate transporter receptor subunit TctC